MKCFNLHFHEIDIYVFNENDNEFKKLKELENGNYIDLENIDSLYAICCKNCSQINYDFNSNFQIKHNNTSFFYFSNSNSINELKQNNKNFSFYEFVIFDEKILMGTKSEIISYISRRFNSLQIEYSRVKAEKNLNEKSIDEIKKDLRKEKLDKEKMKNTLDNIRREKNGLAENLAKEKSLTSELNSKMEKLNAAQINLENKVQKLNVNLSSEKNKNKELNTKLDNISFENNANIQKVLVQVEKEQLKNKNLGTKISELEQKEKLQMKKNIELEGTIKEKEKVIQNLKNNNKNLGNNIQELEKDLNVKKDEIKKINYSLIEAKNINQNLSINFKSEKEKNKELNDKLDNIANKNNENVNKVLEQLDQEKKIHENLKNKYSKLEEEEKIKDLANKDLELKLQKKEEELNYVKNNYNPEKFGLKFSSDSKKGGYDIILDINSIIGLIKEGWKVFYNQKDLYYKRKEEKTIVVGVIGNKNMGKTFFLEKLSGYEIPKGFNVKTVGLSVRYGTSPSHSVAILDSAGQETPLLKMNPLKNIENEKGSANANENVNEEKCKEISEDKKEEKEKKEQEKKIEQNEDENNNEFEKYSRDKLITEFFLQKFIIKKSDIIILVVGNISLTEQKLLYTLKEEVKNLDKNKQIFVIHNLKEYSTEEQVNDYIENTLKRLCKIKLEETQFIKMSEENSIDDKKHFNTFFIEEDENTSHFIFVNEFSKEKAEYYNTPTIEYIQKEIEVIKTRNKFSLIEDCKEFLVEIAEDIMEESIKKEDLITISEEKYDVILLKNVNEINLKSYVINEIGLASRNDSNEPKHSCYIDKKLNKLYVNIELPGGGKPHKKLTVEGNFYLFTFYGEKYGDKSIEEDDQNQVKQLKKIVNKRESTKYKFHIKIPLAEIYVKPGEGKELKNAGKRLKEKEKENKGVLTYEYDIMILNQKKGENDDDDDDSVDF